MNPKIKASTPLDTKATSVVTRTRTLGELKADIDSKLEQELIAQAAQYESYRRVELGLSV